MDAELGPSPWQWADALSLSAELRSTLLRKVAPSWPNAAPYWATRAPCSATLHQYWALLYQYWWTPQHTVHSVLNYAAPYSATPHASPSFTHLFSNQHFYTNSPPSLQSFFSPFPTLLHLLSNLSLFSLQLSSPLRPRIYRPVSPLP